MNRALWTSIIGIAAAQALKVSFNKRHNGGERDWRRLVGSGGMPSSHSAGVASLATYLGLRKGVSSTSFALAMILGLIVMYDAMGIRRQTGLIATEVNEIEDTVAKLAEQHPTLVHEKRDKELEERLGHLPAEVAAGAMLGMLTGMLSFMTEPRRKPSKWPRLIPKLWSRLM
ncbi:divergent PAP2 family protein [Paenibacillus allorhizosphaerae]|uniref:Divergent PAP2 family protein n=1 Tax=Paenibacillus allorhizosphaerae TaxID=2849866 RepID=A0ABN7TEY0_9BACL|nr:divergent PAP2 family protein [Paenibacillus allorhizosphaerae]CAG7622002.1 hypothetical protein PAECIP111802_00779 [Paenibacillus allorhizosphaerae]